MMNTVLFSAYTSAAKYSPNFKDTEIAEFINIVGKNLNKTMIVDPNVRGKVNLRTQDELTEQQYYQVFLNVLEVSGFAAVEMDNNVVKVIRNKDAKTSSIPVVGDENPGIGDEMVTRVVEVKNVTVRELTPLLRQLSDQAGGGNVVDYSPANVIMLTGTAAVVNRLVNIIERVDKAGDQDVQIIKLQYASAAEMVRIIEAMNKSTQGKSGTSTFLIPKIVADERTNSVIVSGESQARARVAKLISRLDSELETNGNTRVYYLKYSKAEDLVKVLEGVSKSIEAENSSSQGGKQSSKKRNVSIDAHEDTNTLVITAQQDMLRSLEDVIRKLDVRRAQVLVEAIIVEVFESDGVSLGVQWFSEEGGFTQFNNGPAPISAVAAAAESAQTTAGDPGSFITNSLGEIIGQNPAGNDIKGDYSLAATLLGSVSGGMFGIMKNGWGAIIQAVSNDTNSNILATPSITTLDNEEAHFLVGQEIPILTGSSTGSNNGNPFQTVERQEVGIKLTVTPQVNEGSGVQLTIEQEVSSVSGATGVDISINKREIKTVVMADSGATVVLGGLIDEDVQESVQKVPLLGDIPFIGHLFKSTTTSTRKRNLMVFIRPTIIRDGKMMNEISKDKYNYIRATEIRKQEEGLSLMSDEKMPLLPEWNDKLALPPSFDEYMKGSQLKAPSLLPPAVDAKDDNSSTSDVKEQ
ncbi:MULTISPECIES: type II secretion system secretin GspD [unclassified Colwellia]|uniref:type II secretion system secretin GspD n=1 Tax=unclassified Colwellia TaxID=196834 RepID=UPI0015F72D49|nr:MULTISPECIES: type II secretion system secretin GspD [unclassified Colwellia]MBA6232851.1 type II secretion system secretin GspD [Colwellia sp. MB02u-7]MBA6236056.1 type II secretion system secretin GspD [Colwellia sp. MB02u-11]MBA6256690.1 type II secretion system secretin GspD [Colwellia sp. MB3u-28]MBA6261405.1 type II secretion system secretin GspD [Colwellia sp. MB3u-41]MBA6298539.1 type II secretion system secretin GspD [Colwellia sp. MB3u-22]